MGERVNMYMPTPMTMGATSEIHGNRELLGGSGTSGSSTSVFVGRASTRGGRMKATSVPRLWPLRFPTASIRTWVPPSTAMSPAPRVARVTRWSPTTTPLAESSSMMSMPAPTSTRAWDFETLGSVSRTSL